MELRSEMKFDIIILAGQSNAEGHGIRTESEKEIINERVYQLVDKNPIFFCGNEKGETVLNITIPTEMIIDISRDRKTGDNEYRADLTKTFSEEYIKNGNLAKDRNLLIVKAAVGGTGFMLKQWGVGNTLSNRLFEMTDYALSLNKDNRIVAFLWHQGEHDVVESPEMQFAERYEFYFNHFFTQMKAVRARYADFKFPIIAGEFVNDWADKHKEPCDAVEKATRDVCLKIGDAAVVSSDGLLSNDQNIKNGDDIHFSVNSVYELGKRYYAQFVNLLEERRNK
ncbi:MAG: hypothetical protein IJQ07_05775 [Clostridia bacterium]|nr:hypothetical protein [Clostridia bacterium]